jgi:iron complex outermembrane recepter protein
MRIRFLIVLLVARCLSGQTPARPPDTIVVTGTYEPVPLEESDRSVAVLPTEESRRLLFNDLTDVLRFDPSVDLQSRGPGNIQTDISIRGTHYGQTLVLWNGIRLNDAQTGHHDLDTPVPLDSLSRIEVLKGAGSTIYGSDAVGGVVNFVSQPPETSEARIRTSVGNSGINQQSLQVSLVGKAWTQDVIASRDFSSGFRFDRDYRNLSAASLTHYFGRLGTTDLALAWSDRPFGADQFYGNYPSWERTKSWLAGLRHAFGPATEVTASYRRHTDDFVLFRYQPERYQNRHELETFTGAVRRNQRLGVNTTFHYGADGAYDSLSSSNLGLHARGRGGFYAALDIRALGRFSLNAGAREEVYQGLRRQFSPSLTGGVWISPKLRLRAGVSHAFRLPTFTELYYHDPGNFGDPGLRPERSWSSEAAAEWRPASSLLAQVVIFDRREGNGIDYARANAADPWRAMNVARANTAGVEAGVSARLREGRMLTLSYTGLRLRTDSIQGLMMKYISNSPVHNANAAFEGIIARRLLFRASVGAMQRTGRDPYPLVAFRAALAEGAVRPFMQFTNLTNTSYQEVTGVVMPGRTVVGGIEIRTRLPW